MAGGGGDALPVAGGRAARVASDSPFPVPCSIVGAVLLSGAGPMESWITPTLLVALAALTVGMIRSLRSDMEKHIDRVDQRMDRLETGLGEVKEGLAEVRGELSFVRDYILRRNAPAEEPPAAPAE